MKIKIKDDLYDIAARIKEIDPHYEIFFETELQKFTLWAKGARQVVFPYENLDQRALVYAAETRVEHLDELVKKIDDNNERYQEERTNKVRDKIEDEFSRRLRLAGI